MNNKGAIGSRVLLGISALTILSMGASFARAYLFKPIKQPNRLEQEREAHYYNSTQIALGIKYKLEKILIRSNKKNINAIIHSAIKPNEDSRNGELTYTIQELIDHRLLRIKPDPTATRLLKKKTYYDFKESSCRLVFIDTNGNRVKSNTLTDLKKINIWVNLISEEINGEKYVYLGMYYDDAYVDINTITIDTEDPDNIQSILDPNIVISKTTFPLPDDKSTSSK